MPFFSTSPYFRINTDKRNDKTQMSQEIDIENEKPLQDKKAFSDLGLSQFLLEAINKKGFENPTPIQAQVIPLLLEKSRDVVAQSQTGTGKTAAFGLPILDNFWIRSSR